MKIAGIPTRGSPLPRSPPTPAEAAPAPVMNNQTGSQLALTQAALDTWGQKIVTWGKKNKGRSFVVTYEQDHGYVKWILARIGSLHEDIEDFANYCLTRRRLEEVARQQILN